MPKDGVTLLGNAPTTQIYLPNIANTSIGVKKELNTLVFIMPGKMVKNREERLVMLNRVARSVIEEVRGINSDYVFT